MEKRHVRFENTQDALLWLMSHRNSNENDSKLYDQYGNYVIHAPYNNTIEHHYYEHSIDDNGYDNSFWDFERLSYEEFIKRFEGIVLENQ